jgi:hypothetical protein
MPAEYPNGSAPMSIRGISRRNRTKGFNSTSKKFFGKFSISGVTRDSSGAALGNCACDLFETATDTVVARTISDVNGLFSFAIGTNSGFFYIVAYKATAPDVTGATVNFVVGSEVTNAPSNLTVDVWEDFDIASLTTGNLDTNDHATGQTWTLTNPSSLLSVSTSGETPMLSTVNGQSGTGGTKGLSYNCNATGIAGYAQCAFPAAKNSVSFGFWFQYPASFNGTFTEHDILQVETTLGNKNVYIKLADGNLGTNIQSIHIFNPTDNYSPGIAVSPVTWYWISVQYLTNIASTGMKVRVFNSVGTQVGIENTRGTAADSGVVNCKIGSQIGGAAFVGTMYYDDLVIDYTNAVYPLGP